MYPVVEAIVQAAADDEEGFCKPSEIFRERVLEILIDAGCVEIEDFIQPKGEDRTAIEEMAEMDARPIDPPGPWPSAPGP